MYLLGESCRKEGMMACFYSIVEELTMLQILQIQMYWHHFDMLKP